MAGPIAASRTPGQSRPPVAPHDGEIEGEARTALADVERSHDRSDGREEFVRLRPRQPHEIYDLDPSRMKKGMDYFFAAATIQGQPNPRFREYLRAGWTPARAEDFPELSGIDVRVNQRLVDLGFMSEVKPDDPVENRGLMLMMRPKPLSDKSRAEEQQRATGQIADHLNRLNLVSRRSIGERTQISRRSTRGSPPPDMIPEDADFEE